MSEKLKIAMAMDSYLPTVDGVTMAMDNYCSRAVKKADVTVLAPKNRKDYEDEFEYKVIRCASIYIPVVKIFYGTPETDVRFKKTVENQKFDIIHVHSPFNMARFSLKLAKKQHIPVVATFHTNFRRIFKTVFKTKFLTEAVIRDIGNAYNQMDEVFVCSPIVEKQARSYGYTGKITYMPLGTEFEKADNKDELRRKANEYFHITEDELVFLYVGRITSLKRIEYIIDSLNILKKRGLKFRFYIVGKGFYSAALKRRCESYGFSGEEVIFTGFLDRELFPCVYARADLLLFPSLFDTFGLVKIEAAAFSTPGVFIKDTATAYGVTDGRNGFISEDSVEAYAEKIAEAVKDKEKLRQTGVNAGNELYISWDDCTDILIEKYKELIERKKTEVVRKPRDKTEFPDTPGLYKRAVKISAEAKKIKRKTCNEYAEQEDKLYREAQLNGKVLQKTFRNKP